MRWNRCFLPAALALGCAKVLGFERGELGAEAAQSGASHSAGAGVTGHAGASSDAGGEAAYGSDQAYPPKCGNQQLDADEECDGDKLGDATCASVGNGAGGTLRCQDCEYDSSECYHVRSLDVSSHACARLTNDKLKCWGANRSGQLGLGDKEPRGEEGGEMGAHLPFVDLGGRSVLEVSTGFDHTCALVQDEDESRQVVCWGSNFYGQLGQPDVDEVLAPSREGNVELGEGAVVNQVAAGGDHTCVLFDKGQVKCWGNNQHGQLGLGHTEPRGKSHGEMANLPFVNLGSDLKVQTIAAGQNHTCVLTTSGAVKCWGSNGQGQLGIGTPELNRGDGPDEMGDDLDAVDVGFWSAADQLSAGGQHNCVQRVTQSKCWGYNAEGQLGIGDSGSRGLQPGDMGDALPIGDLGPDMYAGGLSAGFSHTCAWSFHGTVKCWGSNAEGELGLGDVASRGNLPGQMGQQLPYVDLGSSPMIRSVHAGNNVTCAILEPGRVKCWGRNSKDSPTLGAGHKNSIGIAPGQMGEALPFVEL